jgi:hypothetical protein
MKYKHGTDTSGMSTILLVLSKSIPYIVRSVRFGFGGMCEPGCDCWMTRSNQQLVIVEVVAKELCRL